MPILGGLAVQQVISKMQRQLAQFSAINLDFTTRIAKASTRNRTYLERPGLLRPQHDENVVAAIPGILPNEATRKVEKTPHGNMPRHAASIAHECVRCGLPDVCTYIHPSQSGENFQPFGFTNNDNETSNFSTLWHF